MDLFEALYTTRAMRRMERRDVPDEVLARLIDAAIRAPSGGNFQNWRFVVIRDPATKEFLGSLFRADVAAARRGAYLQLEEAHARGERGEEVDSYVRMIRSVEHLARHFAEIPLYIAALLRSESDELSAGGSIYPAVWSLQLAARAHGIGSVPVGSLASHQDVILPRLAVPPDEGWRLATCVALGYPTGRWGVAARRPAHEVTFVEQWGRPPEWTVQEALWPEASGSSTEATWSTSSGPL